MQPQLAWRLSATRSWRLFTGLACLMRTRSRYVPQRGQPSPCSHTHTHTYDMSCSQSARWPDWATVRDCLLRTVLVSQVLLRPVALYFLFPLAERCGLSAGNDLPSAKTVAWQLLASMALCNTCTFDSCRSAAQHCTAQRWLSCMRTRCRWSTVAWVTCVCVCVCGARCVHPPQCSIGRIEPSTTEAFTSTSTRSTTNSRPPWPWLLSMHTRWNSSSPTPFPRW